MGSQQDFFARYLWVIYDEMWSVLLRLESRLNVFGEKKVWIYSRKRFMMSPCKSNNFIM